MIGRREFVLGAAAAGVLMQPRFGYANASQPATRHQRSQRCDRALPRRRRAHKEPQLAYPAQHDTAGDRRDERRARRLAGDAGVRSLRQCKGGAWGGAARLLRSGEPREIRQSLCQISVTAGPRENYSYFTPLAQMLISANVDRILWGTNWPHPNSVDGSTSKVTPLWQVDDGLVFNLLPTWAPDAAMLWIGRDAPLDRG